MNIKLILIVVFGLLFVNIKVTAQQDNGTSTNPANPHPSTGVGSNLWDWTSQITGKGSYNGNGAMYYKINPGSSMYQNYSVPPIQGYPIGIESPYYNSNSTQLANYIAHGAASDFNWSDGWELITRNFGYAYDEVSNATTDAIVPYFILYNKYSGTLRVFGVLPDQGGSSSVNSVTVELKFLSPADEQSNPHYQNYKYSALLGVNGGSSNPDPVSGIRYGKAQALDMPTTVNNISKVCPFTGYNNQFFYADFAVGYDPCSCWNSGALQVSFLTNITGTINLMGRFIGSSVSIADLTNGDNSLPDPVGYLAGVNTQNSDVATGTLVYENIQELASDYATQLGNNQTNQQIASHLDEFAKGTALAAKESALLDQEKAALFFEALSALTDFISTLVPEGEQTPASVIQGEMAMTGSLNITTQNPEAFVKFSLPGAPSVVTNPPEFYTASNPVPNYPKYNEVLGPFALLQTPAINVSELTVPFSYNYPHAITNYYYRDEFQVTDAVKYIFNPSAHVDYNKSIILVALELEYVGYPPSGPAPTANGFSVHGATWNYTYQPDPNIPKVYMHYTTEFVDPAELSNLVIAVENDNGLYQAGSTPNVYNVYLKLIVDLVSTDLKSDGVTPNQSILVFTYPITVYNVNTSNNITGFPLSVTAGPDLAAPESATIGTTNYTSSGNVYVWDNVTIAGSLTANAGVSEKILTYDGQIYMQPGSHLGPGLALAYGKPVFQPNPNTGRWTGTGNLQSWCTGGTNSSLPNPYKASSLGANIPAARISEKPVHGISTNHINTDSTTQTVGSLEVYPNPFSDHTRIRYSIPEDANVELSLYDIMGEKAKDIQNSFQNAGKYTIDFQSGNLESGVYILQIKAGGYSDMQRIVIVK